MSNVPDETIEKILEEVAEVGSDEMNRIERILRHNLQTDQPSLAGCDEAFEQWWFSYPKCPRKVRKKKCLAIWRRLWKVNELPGIPPMLATLEAQMQHWQKEEWKYVPLPQTYLNGAQWEDEVASAPTLEEQRDRREKGQELYRRLQGLEEGDGEGELNRATVERFRKELGLD